MTAPWPDARDDLAEVLRTTTPAQRLQWVEEMLDLAHASGALEKARRIEQEERRAAFAAGREGSHLKS